MHLEFEFELLGNLRPPVDIGEGPYGFRRYFEVSGGKASGKRLNGKLLTGGGDWMLVRPDGFAHLDVRFQMVTDDGALIYSYYTGLLELNEKVLAAGPNGGSTDYRDQYFRTSPRFETGDARYDWLNQHLFIGEGRIHPGAVEYKVYNVT